MQTLDQRLYLISLGATTEEINLPVDSGILSSLITHYCAYRTPNYKAFIHAAMKGCIEKNVMVSDALSLEEWGRLLRVNVEFAVYVPVTIQPQIKKLSDWRGLLEIKPDWKFCYDNLLPRDLMYIKFLDDTRTITLTSGYFSRNMGCHVNYLFIASPKQTTDWLNGYSVGNVRTRETFNLIKYVAEKQAKSHLVLTDEQRTALKSLLPYLVESLSVRYNYVNVDSIVLLDKVLGYSIPTDTLQSIKEYLSAKHLAMVLHTRPTSASWACLALSKCNSTARKAALRTYPALSYICERHQLLSSDEENGTV